MGKSVTRIIHLKHLFFYLVKKWYVLLLAILIGVGCFSLLGVVNIKQEQKKFSGKPLEKETEIYVSEAEFYNVSAIVEFEDILEEKNKYIDNSIKMKIDPYHKWDCSDTFTIAASEDTSVTDVNEALAVCQEFVSSQAFFEELSNRMENKVDAVFLKEIVTVTVTSPNTISISAFHYDKAELRNLCDLMSQIFFEHAKQAVQLNGYQIYTKKGVPTETLDNGLFEAQKGIRSEAIATQDIVAYRLSILTENEKEYLKLYRDARYDTNYVPGQELIKVTTVEKQMPTLSLSALKGDMIKGLVVGMVAAIVILCCIYIFHPCVLNPYNLIDMLGLRLLNDRKEIPFSASELPLITFKVEQNIPDGNKEKMKLLITGSMITDGQNEVLKAFKNSLEELGIDILIAKSLKDYPEELGKLKQVDQVIFVEHLGKSRWDYLTWQVSLCQEINKEINGVLLI